MSTPRAATRYKINLKIEPAFRRKVDPAVLRAAARAALTDQAAPAPCELTLLITGDGELRTLNRDFLGIDRPTDVLSFPSDEPDPVNGRLYLGDIAISFPQARTAAQRGGHPVKAELQLWAAQAAILAGLKAAITGPSDDGPAVS
jgi:rRNA maturation RNase YbeY